MNVGDYSYFRDGKPISWMNFTEEQRMILALENETSEQPVEIGGVTYVVHHKKPDPYIRATRVEVIK